MMLDKWIYYKLHYINDPCMLYHLTVVPIDWPLTNFMFL